MDIKDIHDKIKVLFSDYLRSTISLAERVEVDQHLAHCASCRHELAELKVLASWMQEIKPAEPPASFYDQVMRRLREAPASARPKSFWFTYFPYKWIATGAVSVLLVYLATDRTFRSQKTVNHMTSTKTSEPILTDSESAVDNKAAKATARAIENQSKPFPWQESAMAQQDIPAPAAAPVSATEGASLGAAIGGAARGKGAELDRRTEVGEINANVNALQKSKSGLSDSLSLEERTVNKNDNDKQRAFDKVESPSGSAKLKSHDSPTKFERNDVAGREQMHSQTFAINKEAKKTPAPASPQPSRQRTKAQVFNEWRGTSSEIRTFHTAVVFNQKEWYELWKKHKGETSHSQPPPAAFDEQMVVAVFSGTKPTAGYSVRITEVIFLTDQMEVVYEEKEPARDAFVAQMQVEPYDMQLVPRTKLPVRFMKKGP